MKQGDVTIQNEAIILPDAVVVTVSRTLTDADNSVGYTGVGFRPRLMWQVGGVSGTLSPTIGFAMRGITQRCTVENVTGANEWYPSGVFARYVNAGSTVDATITSLDTDGFTISYVKSSAPSGTWIIYAMCVK